MHGPMKLNDFHGTKGPRDQAPGSWLTERRLRTLKCYARSPNHKIIFDYPTFANSRGKQPTFPQCEIPHVAQAAVQFNLPGTKEYVDNQTYFRTIHQSLCPSAFPKEPYLYTATPHTARPSQFPSNIPLNAPNRCNNIITAS